MKNNSGGTLVEDWVPKEEPSSPKVISNNDQPMNNGKKRSNKSPGSDTVNRTPKKGKTNANENGPKQLNQNGEQKSRVRIRSSSKEKNGRKSAKSERVVVENSSPKAKKPKQNQQQAKNQQHHNSPKKKKKNNSNNNNNNGNSQKGNNNQQPKRQNNKPKQRAAVENNGNQHQNKTNNQQQKKNRHKQNGKSEELRQENRSKQQKNKSKQSNQQLNKSNKQSNQQQRNKPKNKPKQQQQQVTKPKQPKQQRNKPKNPQQNQPQQQKHNQKNKPKKQGTSEVQVNAKKEKKSVKTVVQEQPIVENVAKLEQKAKKKMAKRVFDFSTTDKLLATSVFNNMTIDEFNDVNWTKRTERFPEQGKMEFLFELYQRLGISFASEMISLLQNEDLTPEERLEKTTAIAMSQTLSFSDQGWIKRIACDSEEEPVAKALTSALVHLCVPSERSFTYDVKYPKE
ncbi:hypothetical protein PCE1_003487 [Barthelona sp. PCE]